jgi:hypothetical protein
MQILRARDLRFEPGDLDICLRGGHEGRGPEWREVKDRRQERGADRPGTCRREGKGVHIHPSATYTTYNVSRATC